MTMSTPNIPLHWILEYAVSEPTKFTDAFILALLDQISSVPDQPPVPPLLVIALLKHVFAHSDGSSACDFDHAILDTIEYLELLETQRLKRVKALEKRGGPLVTEYIRTSVTAKSRFNFVLIGIKYWTVYNEISRVPFNMYNTLSLIAQLFPEDSLTQSQIQEGSPSKPSQDAQRRIEMTTLVNHISKGLIKMTQEQRDVYDASQHPTLLKNEAKMPWQRLTSVLTAYLDSTKILFERSEIMVNPERRIQGVKIDDKMIQLAAESLQKASGL